MFDITRIHATPGYLSTTGKSKLNKLIATVPEEYRHIVIYEHFPDFYPTLKGMKRVKDLLAVGAAAVPVVILRPGEVAYISEAD